MTFDETQYSEFISNLIFNAFTNFKLKISLETYFLISILSLYQVLCNGNLRTYVSTTSVMSVLNRSLNLF